MLIPDQSDFLRGHPIFASKSPLEANFDLSLNNLSRFKVSGGPLDHTSVSNEARRRKIMTFRESDILLAVGSEIRITSLSEASAVNMHSRSYKTLYTPNIEFEVHQMSVNHNGKLLAVAGTQQVAVVSLPRAGYSKLVSSRVDCRTIQVGQFHHATTSAVPVSKIEWHPWGKNACTLLVMTVDGILREYDISLDPEEPQQTLSFMPERPRTSSVRGDSSSRDVVSFCLGKGKADWGPLTVYALTKSGDIWAMCPFIPSNATVPSAYIHALEYFVRAKEESATNFHVQPQADQVSLSKQLPIMPSTVFPSPSRLVPIMAPSIVKSRPMRQGPFLFQPAPRELDQGEGGNATDLEYINIAGTSPLHPVEDENEERLGVLAVVYSDGKVDICLDVEKIEAMWESSRLPVADDPASELPMVAVYETIDLGLVSMLSRLSSESASWLRNQRSNPKDYRRLLQVNHPIFVLDPIYQDTLYVYHSFGVHRLNMSRWLQPLTNSLRIDVDRQVKKLVEEHVGSEVTCMLDTFSSESGSFQPVFGVVLPSDVYLSYSLFMVTSSLDFQLVELALRVDPLEDNQPPHPSGLPPLPRSAINSVPSLEAKDPSLVSLLAKNPYDPPRAISMVAIDDIKGFGRLPSGFNKQDFKINSESLREFVTIVQRFQSHIRDIHMALHGFQDRLMLQDKEFQRQQDKYVEIVARTDRLKNREYNRLEQRFERTTAEQKRLLARSDKLLQMFMDASSPTLNEHEKRWFEELRRMKSDVVGEGSYDSTSLKARTDTVSNKLEYYMPSLKELSKLEEQRRQETASNPVTLGRGQEMRILMRLGEHKKMLSDTVKRVEQLAQKMNVDLEGLPNLG